jgi:hypothetical protein
MYTSNQTQFFIEFLNLKKKKKKVKIEIARFRNLNNWAKTHI